MNSRRKPFHAGHVVPKPFPAAALSVVVYRNPGPDDDAIGMHAESIVKRCSAAPPGGGLGYITFVESDFDRLWAGVDRGDALGTAYSVLPFLGPGGSQFVGRVEDFLIGWIGHSDETYGNLLLLQIFPRQHMLTTRN
jgi:hypothetical protein